MINRDIFEDLLVFGFAQILVLRQFLDTCIVPAPLEEMFPFLDRKKLLENLLVPDLEGCSCT